MSVQLQDRVESVGYIQNDNGSEPTVGSGMDSVRYGSIALKAWFVGVFLLTVSLPAGSLIAAGVVNDVEPGSIWMYASFILAGIACLVLWGAVRLERVVINSCSRIVSQAT